MIIKDIQDAEPTDGIWEDGRTDYDQIGATYKEIEWAMENLGKSDFNEKEKALITLYTKHNARNKHKMITIPICVIPKELKKN